MRVALQHIGKVQQAAVELAGLTVLTGLNGTGKSTIGKALYCALESIDGTSDYNRLLDSIRQNNDLNPDILDLINKVQEEHPIYHTENTHTPRSKHNQLIQSVFQRKYNSTISNPLATITVESNESLAVQVLDHQTISFEQQGVLPWKAIMIETPVILSLYAYFKENLAFSDNQKRNALLLPHYTKKLVRLISESGDFYNPDYTQPLVQQIEAIISGQVVLINDAIYFKDAIGHTHPILNVASGVKSFGLLQLLAAGNLLDTNSILIIDEPEVHLHPEWQLKYAEILIALVQQGVRLLVTSHSPYFIEALKVYSDNASLQERTHFYWGALSDQGSVFEEVSGDLEPIFGSFSYPMVQLVKARS